MDDNKNTQKYKYILYTVVALATLWNIRETHKIRVLQKKDLERRLKN